MPPVTGAVTLIQRFGSALNLNSHFHMIFLDGVYLPVEGASPVFRHVPAPTVAELQALVQQIAARIGNTTVTGGHPSIHSLGTPEIGWMSHHGAPIAELAPGTLLSARG